MNTIKKLLYGVLIAGSTLGGMTSCYTSSDSKDNASEKTEMISKNNAVTNSNNVILKLLGSGDDITYHNFKKPLELKIKKPIDIDKNTYKDFFSPNSPNGTLEATKLEALIIDGKDTTKLIMLNNSGLVEVGCDDYRNRDLKILLTIKDNNAKIMSYSSMAPLVFFGRVNDMSLRYSNDAQGMYAQFKNAERFYSEYSSNISFSMINYHTSSILAKYNLLDLTSEIYFGKGDKILAITKDISKEFANAQKEEFGLSLTYLKILEDKLAAVNSANALFKEQEKAYKIKKASEIYNSNKAKIDNTLQW